MDRGTWVRVRAWRTADELSDDETNRIMLQALLAGLSAGRSHQTDGKVGSDANSSAALDPTPASVDLYRCGPLIQALSEETGFDEKEVRARYVGDARLSYGPRRSSLCLAISLEAALAGSSSRAAAQAASAAAPAAAMVDTVDCASRQETRESDGQHGVTAENVNVDDPSSAALVRPAALMTSYHYLFCRRCYMYDCRYHSACACERFAGNAARTPTSPL